MRQFANQAIVILPPHQSLVPVLGLGVDQRVEVGDDVGEGLAHGYQGEDLSALAAIDQGNDG